jgi:hypothetical protein
MNANRICRGGKASEPPSNQGMQLTVKSVTPFAVCHEAAVDKYAVHSTDSDGGATTVRALARLVPRQRGLMTGAV